MLYHLHDLGRAALAPLNVAALSARAILSAASLHPAAAAALRGAGATAASIERLTRRYPKRPFGILTARVDGREVGVEEEEVLRLPFCALRRFRKACVRRGPEMLLVAPMSGHFATLLKPTVEGFLPDHDVYVTDWADAKTVPTADGRFGFDDYVAYLTCFIRALGSDVHVVAVCQPCVQVLAAVALMAATDDPAAPRSMTLMAGPVDTRINPTAVNRFATARPIDWFARNLIATVPPCHPGRRRKVYPGFMQLLAFMSMNLERHAKAHLDLHGSLARGETGKAETIEAFYDEYFATCDIPAEFYLETLETVFRRRDLARGRMRIGGKRVDPRAIRRTALMTVEGGRDDISAEGQTYAAHRICASVPKALRRHHLEPDAGHYGVFSGKRFRASIQPAISRFIADVERAAA